MAVETDLCNHDSEPFLHARQYMTVLLRVLGSSPAWPNPGQAHAGYLLRSPETQAGSLLIDCGPGVLSRLRTDDLLPVGAIVVSHLHLDHWGDLVPWCWYAARLPQPDAKTTELWLPEAAKERLEVFAEMFGRAGMFEATFSVREYGERQPFSTAGFDIEAREVPHFSEPTFGLRVTDPAGTVIAYSADSAPGRTLAELAEGADLFVCEATLGSPEDDAAPRGHLTSEEAVEIAGSARLLLTHRPVELPSPAGAEVAHDGLELSVG